MWFGVCERTYMLQLSEKDRLILVRLFESLDVGRDGVVDAYDLLVSLTHDENIDLDENGCYSLLHAILKEIGSVKKVTERRSELNISLDEFMRAYLSHRLTTGSESQYRSLFAQIDTQGSKSITANNLSERLVIDVSAANEMLSGLKQSKNGKLTCVL